jgi:hypothetical protein
LNLPWTLTVNFLDSADAVPAVNKSRKRMFPIANTPVQIDLTTAIINAIPS